MTAPFTITLAAGDPISALADACDRLAAADGRPEVLRWARTLRQSWGGPAKIDDELRIAEVFELFVAGAEPTLWAAQLRVARGDRSIAERLRRKMKPLPEKPSTDV